MKDKEKKVKATEEAKKEEHPEEKGVQLTEEEMAKVNAGMWITKAEYDESGPTIAHRKCF